jgi:hypothetical protein
MSDTPIYDNVSNPEPEKVVVDRTPNEWIKNPTARNYIYGIAAATVPLLVATGLITGDIAAHILNIAAAILATGVMALASKNTPNA